MQTKEDAERITFLGAPPERVKVTGNVKYDSVFGVRSSAIGWKKEDLGIDKGENLIICGSTHKGEEEILLKVYKGLLKKFDSLKILIAPRHIDRISDIEKLCAEFNFDSIRLSEINRKPITDNRTPILLLDTIGQLAQIYSLATIVFMGGSLIKRGGHNIVEPALFEKPVCFGPYMGNFRDMAGQFVGKRAAIKVRDEYELERAIEDLLANKAKGIEMGRRAYALVKENKGALDRIISEIRAIL